MKPLHLFVLSALSLLLVACAPTQGPSKQSPKQFASLQDAGGGGGLSGGLDGNAITVSVLLPFSSPDETIATLAIDLFRAIEMALFDLGRQDIVILVEDTGGSEEGAALAAQNAVRRGAQIVIGPLFSQSVAAVSPILTRAKIPVLALSNDRRHARDGVWLLGYLPEQQIERIIIHATENGLTRFGVLLPENAYGAWLKDIIEPIITQFGGRMVVLKHYPLSAQDMFDPVQRLAKYQERKAAHQAELSRLTKLSEDLVPEAENETQRQEKLRLISPDIAASLEALGRTETIGEIPFDAVLMPDGGLNLRNLAPLLPYFDVDPKYVRFLGSTLWDDLSLTKEPPLNGAWFPAANPAGWAAFQKRYQDVYGRMPPRTASLAYDALSLVSAVTENKSQRGNKASALTRPQGFLGIDGPLRLLPDGTNERDFAVLEVKSNRFALISPAANSFAQRLAVRELARARAAQLSRKPQIGWQGEQRATFDYDAR